ncbi:MAG: VOC family protein [Myxococcota bacterium]
MRSKVHYTAALAFGLACLSGCASSTQHTDTKAGQAATTAAIPEAFARGPVPGLVVAGASDAIEFYKTAFGAEEVERFVGEDGRIMHAMMRVGDSFFTLSDEFPEWHAMGPKSLGGTPAALFLYVKDADKTFAKAVEAGAIPKEEVKYMFWGDRYGNVVDPFGHQWGIATRVVDVPQEKLPELAKQAMSGNPPQQPADAKPMAKREGWNTLSVYLMVDNVDETVDYYTKAFGAQVITKIPGEHGTMHAELRIRDQLMMVGQAMAEHGAKSAKALGGTPLTMSYYVKDVDNTFEQAIGFGAEQRKQPENMFWGDRWGELVDPSGHVWGVATHVEDVAHEEMQRRAAEMSKSDG